MARTWIMVSAIAVACYVLINLIVTTDLERVENEVHRLLDLAREGGEDAAAEIMDAFADDYSGTKDIEWIRKQVGRFIGGRQLKSVTVGSFKTLWEGENILIPLLRVTMEFEGWKATMLLTVTCGERDGKWKITRITRTKWG